MVLHSFQIRVIELYADGSILIFLKYNAVALKCTILQQQSEVKKNILINLGNLCNLHSVFLCLIMFIWSKQKSFVANEFVVLGCLLKEIVWCYYDTESKASLSVVFKQFHLFKKIDNMCGTCVGW